MPLKTSITSSFFDRRAVIRRVDPERRKALARAGGLVRIIARRSMRRLPGASAPGTPPHAHSGELKLIYFAYERDTDSVVVGPIRLGSKKGRVPEVLEHGGYAKIKGYDKLSGKRVRKRVRIKARPYMAPALKKASPKFPGLIRDKVLE